MARKNTEAAPKPIDEVTEAPKPRDVKPLHQQTVGEIAYNTYCGVRGWKALDGSPLPAFKDQQEDIASAWELSGNAVRKAVEQDQFFTNEDHNEFKALVREKVAAGLTHSQAVSVVRDNLELRKRAEAVRESNPAPAEETAKA